MSEESIVGIVVMLICSWGSGMIFFLIGHFADKSQKPAHFWAGTDIDPCCVSDIAAYNYENAVMWKLYSLPYWLAGLLSCFGWICDGFIIAGAVLLFASCIPGIPILIRKYKQIELRYINSKTDC